MKIKRLNENAIIPTRGSSAAAGYDLYTTDETMIARSGLATKEGLRPANCVGVIDADYRGELKVPLHNDSDVERPVTAGERIAQLVIMPFLAVDFEETDELSDTARSTGGFGSTGKG